MVIGTRRTRRGARLALPNLFFVSTVGERPRSIPPAYPFRPCPSVRATHARAPKLGDARGSGTRHYPSNLRAEPAPPCPTLPRAPPSPRVREPETRDPPTGAHVTRDDVRRRLLLARARVYTRAEPPRGPRAHRRQHRETRRRAPRRPRILRGRRRRHPPRRLHRLHAPKRSPESERVRDHHGGVQAADRGDPRGRPQAHGRRPRVHRVQRADRGRGAAAGDGRHGGTHHVRSRRRRGHG